MNVRWVIVKHYKDGTQTIWHEKFTHEQDADRHMQKMVINNADPTFSYAIIERRVYADLID